MKWNLGSDSYSKLLATAELKKASTVYADCRKILTFRARYEAIGRSSKCPWWVPAVIHMRESDNDFRGVLHNGERIIGTGRKTKLVPRGRGPFNSFEESAADALKIENIGAIKTWNVEMSLGFLERYNGLGYRNRGIPSPYLWSYTSQYSKGKFVGDGQFSRNTVDQQIGCVALLLGWRDMNIFLEGIMTNG